MMKKLWPFLLLLVLLLVTVGARFLLGRAPEPAPTAIAEPAAAIIETTAAPKPSATPSPTPSPTAKPAPTRPVGYPKTRGYSEKTYKLVSDLVYSYANLQDDGIAEQLRLLDELKQEDFALGWLWQDIMDYWRYVNSDFKVEPGAVPEGLPEDDSLCVVVLGFQLEPYGVMSWELEGRCETALACLERYPEAVLAVTGGGTASQNPDATEAGAMAAWFRENGFEGEIIMEDASLTTADNAINTCALLHEYAPQVKELLIVSSDYHLPLGCLVFEEQALLYAYEEGEKPFSVAGWAGWDSGGWRPESPLQQKLYLWRVADPKY